MAKIALLVLLGLTTAPLLVAARARHDDAVAVSVNEAALQLAEAASRILVREASRVLGEKAGRVDAAAVSDPEVYGILQTALQTILNGLKGEKETPIDKIEIDKDNWLDRITLTTSMNDYIFDMTDKTKFKIRNLTLPFSLIHLSGVYKFSDFVVPGLGLTVYGEGKFAVKMENLWATMSMSGTQIAGEFSIAELTADASLSNVTVEFEDLMNGEPMGQFINEMLTGIILIAIDLMGGFVEAYNEVVRNLISEILNKLFQ